MIYIWKVERKNSCGYDEYDSFVIAAETEEEARCTSPDGAEWDGEEWPMWGYFWPVKPSEVEVTKLGTAEPNIENRTVLLASYNAG